MKQSLRWVSAAAISALLLGTGSLAQLQKGRSDFEAKARPQVSLEERLRVGGSQHEIVTVLIDAGRFREAESAFREILALGLTGDHEVLVVQSAWKVVEKLRGLHQYNVAHRIVGSTLEAVDQLDNRHTLLMLRAKIYQEQRNLPKALETLEQAKALVGPQFRTPR